MNVIFNNNCSDILYTTSTFRSEI